MFHPRTSRFSNPALHQNQNFDVSGCFDVTIECPQTEKVGYKGVGRRSDSYMQLKGSPTQKSKIMKNDQGFSVLETVIVVMFIGLVAAIMIPKYQGITQAASTVRCAANLLSFAEEIEYLSLEGPSPTQAQVEAMDMGWPNGKRKDYWYIPNNADSNSGHGNDLDGCDEENPGESLPNRECVPMKFLIICKHKSHGDQGDAKYLFITDMYPPMIVPFEEHRHTYLLDAKWWPKEDPGWDQWIGWSPKK